MVTFIRFRLSSAELAAMDEGEFIRSHVRLAAIAAFPRCVCQDDFLTMIADNFGRTFVQNEEEQGACGGSADHKGNDRTKNEHQDKVNRNE